MACAFGRVVEAHHRGEDDRAGGGGDVAQHTAGGDGGLLVIVAQQAHDPAPVQRDVADGAVEDLGAGEPGFVDDQQRVRADPANHSGTNTGLTAFTDAASRRGR